MKKKQIKNPLRRRILRELTGEWRKYLVVSLFLILIIGFVSGMYVANNSMEHAISETIVANRQEDGHFELKEEGTDRLLQEIEDNEAVPVKLYENFYRNESEELPDGGETRTVRVYQKTEKINLASLIEGAFPENQNEIAIDRMHADNVGIEVGDEITVGGQKYTVSGLIAYVNYVTLHEKSSDFMFDAINFDVAMVTEDGFDRLSEPVHYAYAWDYQETPADDIEEKEAADDFLEQVVEKVYPAGNEMEEYMPQYINPAITFAPEDMGADKAMGGALLDIFVVILAFVFAVTVSNTITREASAIGVLRASGYTRGELVRHYLATPVIVTLLASLAGNILGYTVFKTMVVSMYYNSYSLPVYHTLWNAEAFAKTTVVPVILMFAVNLFVITRMLRHTPQDFLRQDLKKTKRRRAVRLPGWKFFRRFRMRIILQNLPSYGIMFAGVIFISMLLALAVGMPDSLDYYQEHAKELMIAKYQYVLTSDTDAQGNRISTEQEEAEPFALRTLQRVSSTFTEEISVYGLEEDSRYLQIEGLGKGEADEGFISRSYAEKYDVRVGDTVTLDEKYEDRSYTFTVKGICEKGQSLAVYLSLDQYRDVFGLDADAFGGYLSNTEITDLDESQIATVITEQEIMKMVSQLDHSMGDYMLYFQVLCVFLAAVLLYLLTKVIIEKNEKAISMTKILGYTDREIASLYLAATTLVLVVLDAVSVGIGSTLVQFVWKQMMLRYSGWFGLIAEPVSYVKIFTFILLGYLLVLFLDFRRIRRIPMEQALKNVE